MFTVRNAVAAAVGIFVLSIGGMCVGFLLPPDSDGMASDSYGTRRHGYRGLFEILNELGVFTTRSLSAPTATLPTDATVLLLRPHAQLVANEPRYLEDLADWVKQGGRVVVAPHSSTWSMQQLAFEDGEITILDALGLPEVTLTSWDDEQSSFDQRFDLDDKASLSDLEEAWKASRAKPPRPVKIEVECRGNLSDLAEDVATIALPRSEEPKAIDVGERESNGTITWSEDNRERLLIASFSQGEGEIVVVAEPLLLANRLVAKADNSVLAARMVARGRSQIVFDEFYHGLSVRGNPFFLLTQPAFATIAAGLLLLIGMLAWRSAIFLGPPLADPRRERRDIGEYVDAMAWFLCGGKGSRQFLLREVHEGVLRRLCEELHFPIETRNAERIANAIHRTSPARAEAFLVADRQARALVAQPSEPRYSDSVQTMKRMVDCL